VHLVDRPSAVQSALFVGQPFPRRSEPGHEARELLNNLFGGLFTSRLMTNLREEHAYTYGARSIQMATSDWGALALMTSVRTDVTAEALGEAVSELRKIAGSKPPIPPTDVELGRARVDLKQQLGQSLAHTGEVAGNVEELFVQRLGAEYLKKYPSLLDGLDVKAVTTECLRIDPTRVVIVIVGDGKVVTPPLKSLGFEVRTVSESLTD
jgi:zinc protease